jgi:hypothetical protein
MALGDIDFNRPPGYGAALVLLCLLIAIQFLVYFSSFSF